MFHDKSYTYECVCVCVCKHVIILIIESMLKQYVLHTWKYKSIPKAITTPVAKPNENMHKIMLYMVNCTVARWMRPRDKYQ